MATFFDTTISTSKTLDELGRIESSEAALGVLRAAVPDLVCPACASTKFEITENYPRQERSALVYYPEDSSIGRSFTPILSISCNDCGLVMSFDEQKLRSRSRRLSD